MRGIMTRARRTVIRRHLRSLQQRYMVVRPLIAKQPRTIRELYSQRHTEGRSDQEEVETRRRRQSFELFLVPLASDFNLHSQTAFEPSWRAKHIGWDLWL